MREVSKQMKPAVEALHTIRSMRAASLDRPGNPHILEDAARLMTTTAEFIVEASLDPKSKQARDHLRDEVHEFRGYRDYRPYTVVGIEAEKRVKALAFHARSMDPYYREMGDNGYLAGDFTLAPLTADGCFATVEQLVAERHQNQAHPDIRPVAIQVADEERGREARVVLPHTDLTSVSAVEVYVDGVKSGRTPSLIRKRLHEEHPDLTVIVTSKKIGLPPPNRYT